MWGMPPHATGQPQGPRRRCPREPQPLAAALAAAALAAAALVPAAEANFGEAPAPAPGREVCRDGKPPRYWDVADDPLYDKPLGITHLRRVGGCACAYEHIDDLTPERLDTYNRQRRPLVIAGAMEGWPAMKNWRDNAYLTQGPWGKHVFPKPPQGLMTEHSPCKFAGRLKWERIGKERFDEWVKQCGVREAKAMKRYLTGKYGIANQELFPETGGKMTFGDVIGEMFGEGRGKKKLQKKWYGKYFLLEMTIFHAHPELWDDNIGALPPILDPEHPDGPRDFIPDTPGKATHNKRALLLGGPMS